MPRPLFSLPNQLPVQFRAIELREDHIDKPARRIEFPFSSETPVERWFGLEVLDHAPGSMNTERVNKGAMPFLLDHDWSAQSHIGIVEKVWTSEARGWARVRMSKNPGPELIWADILDGIRRNISFGYVIDEFEVREPEDGEEESDIPTIIVRKFTPHEISLVTIPADPGVGLGRDASDKNAKFYAVRMSSPGGRQIKTVKDTDTRFDMAEENGRTEQERKRCVSIMTMGTRYGMEDAARRACEENQTTEQFSNFVLSRKFNASPIASGQMPDLGLSQREVRSYSLVKAIRELSDMERGPKLTGLELDASAAMAKVLNRNPKGFFLPPEITRGPSTRDLGVTLPPLASGGGNLVPTEFMPLIEFLRNRLVVRQAGARLLQGLAGDVLIPKQTGTATAQWRTEIQEVDPSDQTFTQVPLTPKRLSSMTILTRQLIAQSAPDIENLVREDLAAVMATTLDFASLFGSGVAPEPRGIINQPGIQRFTFGGGELYLSYVAAVVALDDARIPFNMPAWITSPRSWGAGVSTPRFPNTGLTVVSESPHPTASTCLGYRYLTTQQIPNTGPNEGLVFFGDFSQLLIGMWDGVDVLVDPYTLSGSARIRVVMHHFADIAVRHAEAFAVSTDPGYPPVPPFSAKGNGPVLKQPAAGK
jgi:HK97 family phage major capsid protein